jgi:hypothetical protein
MTKDAKTAIQHLRRTFHARGDLSGPETQSGRKESRDFANGPGAFTGLAKSDSLRDGGAFGSRAAIVVVVGGQSEAVWPEMKLGFKVAGMRKICDSRSPFVNM